MGRLRSIIAAALFATIVVLGTGCSGDGFWKRKNEWKVPEMNAPMPGGSPFASSGAGVVQASGSSPFAGVPSALARLDPKNDKFVKGNATSIAVAWQNKIDYLPDPARNGESGPGLAGQIFLFGSRDQAVLADGTLTVELFDETPRPASIPACKPERWQYNKDVLREMRDVDERFGPNYVVFLPWPAYRPDVTRVRIKVRYDPEHGYPLYAQETKLYLDSLINRDNETGATTVGRAPSNSQQNRIISNAGISSTGAMPAGVIVPKGVTTAVGPPPNPGPSPGLGAMRLTRSAAESAAPTTLDKPLDKPPATPPPAGASSVAPPIDLAAPVTVYPRQP